MATISSSIGSFTPAVRMTVGDSYTVRNKVYDLLGGGVAVTFGATPTRSGTFEFAFLNEYDAYAAYLILRDGYVFEMTDWDADSTNFTFVVNGEISRNWDNSTRSIWTISVDFQEVLQ